MFSGVIFEIFEKKFSFFLKKVVFLWIAERLENYRQMWREEMGRSLTRIGNNYLQMVFFQAKFQV
jgi:hypothetical protein